jgi:uncharacterized membrane protein
MSNVPLHPALVHVPIGIAAILPLIALGLTVALWKGRWPRGVWAVLVSLQLLLVGGGALSLRTGEQEEERVEKVVPEAVIEEHEERAEVFFWTAAALLLPSLAVLFLKGEGARRALMLGVTGGTLAVAGLGVWTGHSGGELVYLHGAAAVYGAGGAPGAPSAPAVSSGGGEREGHED